MRAFRIERFGQPLVAVDCTRPEPQGRQVLLRTLACGVCHSDVHLADGFFDLGGGQRMDLARAIAPPRIPGHEILGEVVALGPEAAGPPIGSRRVVFPWIGCGTCAFCQGGEENLCTAPRALGVNRDGGYAEHVLVEDPKYLFDYAPLPEAQACTLACSGLTAYSALRKLAPMPEGGGRLLVIGAGGVGLSAVRLAHAVLGAAPIVADPDHGKWDMAREAGAAELLDPSEPGAARTLVKSTAGGAAAVLDFVGSGSSFEFGMAALARGGRLVVVGLMGGATSFAPAMLPLKSATVMGSYVGTLAEMTELMRLARSGALPPMPIATRPLTSANEALEELRAGKVRGRLVLTG
jgi:alcohol dehydrogenase/propanol-preferring alcohol dehydrogenase